jgi:hypothetical protein
VEYDGATGTIALTIRSANQPTSAESEITLFEAEVQP